VVSSASAFTGCLEFILEFSLSLEGFNVCHPRHLIYLIFLSLGVMPRVFTMLHLPIAHDDDITRQLANCDETYKFSIYPYIML